MGKQLKRKMQKEEADETAFRAHFAEISRVAKTQTPPAPLVDELAGYLDRCVRDPQTFTSKSKSSNRTKQLLLLVRHAFVEFRPPPILDQAWQSREVEGRNLNVRRGARDIGVGRANSNLAAIDFRDWYITVATGQSLYKTRLRGLATKAETHWFINCPHQITLPQALYYAVARAAGGSEGQALRIGRSKLNEKPFKDEFWRDCARFFSHGENYPASLTQLNDLVDYLSSKHAEMPAWRLFGGGHTLLSLLRKMQDWHYALRRLKVLGDAQWDGHGVDDCTIEHKVDGKTWFWDFKQIKNTKDLAAEGTAMRHCVYSYKHGCVSGSCSIWSLRLRDPAGDSRRRLTIELRDDGQIVQKRGLANRLPKAEENHAISQWCRKAGLC